jgi:hypothetical protein
MGVVNKLRASFLLLVTLPYLSSAEPASTPVLKLAKASKLMAYLAHLNADPQYMSAASAVYTAMPANLRENPAALLNEITRVLTESWVIALATALPTDVQSYALSVGNEAAKILGMPLGTITPTNRIPSPIPTKPAVYVTNGLAILPRGDLSDYSTYVNIVGNPKVHSALSVMAAAASSAIRDGIADPQVYVGEASQIWLTGLPTDLLSILNNFAEEAVRLSVATKPGGASSPSTTSALQEPTATDTGMKNLIPYAIAGGAFVLGMLMMHYWMMAFDF